MRMDSPGMAMTTCVGTAGLLCWTVVTTGLAGVVVATEVLTGLVFGQLLVNPEATRFALTTEVLRPYLILMVADFGLWSGALPTPPRWGFVDRRSGETAFSLLDDRRPRMGGMVVWWVSRRC